MRAKMILSGSRVIPENEGGGVALTFYGVNRGDKDGPSDPSNPYSAEDSLFGRFTPAACVTMTVKNPNVTNKLRLGAKYYVDFTEAEG